MKFEWTPDLQTGNSIIDLEHKKLFDAIHALKFACDNEKSTEEINNAADFLHNYTVTHFSHEETLQEQCNYPDIVNHKIWHSEFLKKSKETSEEFKKNGTNEELVSRFNKLFDSLVFHIKTEDVKLAQFIKSNP